MTDAVSRAHNARNLLERLGARVPGYSGYLERELRREADQLLRRDLASRLDAARAAVTAFTRTLHLDDVGPLARLAEIERSLDSVANAVRHAGSGYGGLFDAVKVREEQLEALYTHDLDMLDSVDAAREAAVALGPDAETLTRVERAVAKVRAALEVREAVVRGVFSQGGVGGGER